MTTKEFIERVNRFRRKNEGKEQVVHLTDLCLEAAGELNGFRLDSYEDKFGEALELAFEMKDVPGIEQLRNSILNWRKSTSERFNQTPPFQFPVVYRDWEFSYEISKPAPKNKK